MLLFFDIIYFGIRIIVLLYPTIKTIQSIKTPRNPILLRWLTYWFIVGILTNISVLGYYFPFYGTIELIVLIILQNKYLLDLVKRYLILNLIRDINRLLKKFQTTEYFEKLENNRIIFYMDFIYSYIEILNG